MKWFYHGMPLKDYLSTIIKNQSDLDFLYVTIERILKKEYTIEKDMDLLIKDILNRDKIKKIIAGEYKKQQKTSWIYHGILLKEYLGNLLENKEDLDYLYDVIKRILKKEYTIDKNMDLLIEDILNRDKIKKIIAGEYEKPENKSWNYRRTSLRNHLYELLKNKEDLDYLYCTVMNILKKEYTLSCNLDSLIDDILSRPKIKEIINGSYSRKEETEWTYQEMSLSNYVEIYIKSPYRSDEQILKRIRDYISYIIQKENLDISKREELLDVYLSSEEFKQFLSTPPVKRTEYFYQGMTLREYLKRIIKNKDNLDYIYKLIISRIQLIYQEGNQELEMIINSVMENEEIKNLLTLEIVPKREREVWPYKGGLLIDYLKTIDLNGKKLLNVYSVVKNAVQRKYKEDFSSIQEKEKATIEFLESEEFRNYLKYGYTDKVYFYSGILLIDYLRIYYEDILNSTNRTVEDLYRKVLYMVFKNQDPKDLQSEEIEKEIDFVLRSNEISEYLLRQKPVLEDWSCHGKKLSDVILKEYSAVIEEEQDVNRIYTSIIWKAKKTKKENPSMPNDTIISFFFTKEFIKNYGEKYSRRKKLRNKFDQNRKLYENRDDFQYIDLYATENGLDITEIVRITQLGFNYYSAMIILEYAREFDKTVDEVINFTLNMDYSENTSLLWLVKLGFKDYIWNIIENNRELIHSIFQKNIKKSYNKNYNYMDYEDLDMFLSEQLVEKFIVVTAPIEYLFMAFKLFINSCIEKYVIDKSHNPFDYRSLSIDNENNSFVSLTSEDNIEGSFIENESTNMIMDAFELLDNLEREFVNLRYGFRGNVNNLHQIKAIWNSKGILVSIEELEKIEKTVLEKLQKNPKILEIKQTA